MALELGQNVIILEIGTAILEALPYLYGAEQLLIIDAVKGGGSPGTLYKTELKDCISNNLIASMHGFDISRVMALAGRSRTLSGLVLGIEPELLTWSMNLSSPVTAALPYLVEAVVAEVYASGPANSKPSHVSDKRG